MKEVEHSKDERKDVDQITKRLIKTFYREFIDFFFPDLAGLIDFNSVEFIDKELFSGQVEGAKNIADILAKVKVKNGEEKIVLCHIEIQSEKEGEFPERMYSYFNNIWMEHKKPVFAFALFLDKSEWRVPVSDKFAVDFMGTTLTYKYNLRKTSNYYYKDYVDHENPVTAALMARMNFGKDSAALVKAVALRKMSRYNLSPLEKEILANFIEKLLFLKEKEIKEFEEIIKEKQYKEVAEMLTSWEEKGIEKGKREKEMEIAQKALERGMEVNIVAEITGLALDIVKNIKESLMK